MCVLGTISRDFNDYFVNIFHQLFKNRMPVHRLPHSVMLEAFFIFSSKGVQDYFFSVNCYLSIHGL